MTVWAWMTSLLLASGSLAVTQATTSSPAAQSRTVQDETALISRASGADGVKGDSFSFNAAVSADGRYVTFASRAANLHPDDTDLGKPKVFVRDLQTDETRLVSRASGADGVAGNNASFNPSISADGRYVAFHSIATNLHPDDPDGIQDVFVRDLQTGETILVSRASGVDGVKGNDHGIGFASLSADGRYVTFASLADNLHPGHSDPIPITDIFVRDLLTHETLLISRASGVNGEKGEQNSQSPSISGDGRYVAFESSAGNLHPDDVDGFSDVFVRDLQTPETILVSRADGVQGSKGNSHSTFPSISGDGRFVAFQSAATNLHPDDSDIILDVLIRDLQALETILVTRAAGVDGTKSNGPSQFPSVSGDGRHVAFQSLGTNLHADDIDDTLDVFVRDLQMSETILVSRASGASGPKGNSDSFHPSVSSEGRYVAFDSFGSNLHPDDPDDIQDVFLRDLRGPLTLSPDLLDFGAIPVGENAAPLSLTLAHAGPGGADDVTVGEISSPEAPFTFLGGTCSTPPFTLSAGERCTLDYTFGPTTPAPAETTISINSDTAGSPHTVTLIGSGISSLSLTPDPLDFEDVHAGETGGPRSVTVTNVSQLEVTVNGVSAPNAPFEPAGDSCGPLPLTLAPDAACTLEYTFNPTLEGPVTTTVTLVHDAPTSPDTLTLRGNGLPARALITLDPDSLSSVLQQGQSEIQALTVANLGAEVLDWEVTEDAAGQVTLTHSESMDVQNRNTVTCGEGTLPQQYLRAFALSDFGITNALEVTEVTFGVENLTVTVPITVNLYTLEGAFVYDNLTLIGSTTVDLPAQSLSLVTLPVSGTAPAGSTLVVEIAAPDLTDEMAAFIPGSNNLGETAPSYVAAAACAAPEPTPYSALPDCPSCADVHLVMTVTGSLPDCTLPAWVDVDPLDGSVAGGGEQVVDVTFDASGEEPGDFEANLCFGSNDPERPLAVVPMSLTVTTVPGPMLVFTPSGLDFGEVEVGDASAPLTATLTNSGDTSATGLTFTQPGSGFAADTGTCSDTLAAGASCEVVVTFTPIEPGPATATLHVDSAEAATADLELAGTGLAAAIVAPVALDVDPDAFLSDGNGVLEPGELVEVMPSWRNDGLLAESLTGGASEYDGTDGAIYFLALDDADYGTVEPGATTRCDVTGVCYFLGVDAPNGRPATHWMASFEETLSEGTVKTWDLHIGDSFTDVPRSSPFYTAIETLLHSGITGGCTETEYCPAGTNTRGQMAVFLLKAAEGGDYLPAACVEGDERFLDVPAGSPLCPWIEELAARDVTAGCGSGNYCPGDPVSRAQMAVFLLRAFEDPGYAPPECTGELVDVTCPSPFAAWVEELAARGVTGGCSVDPPAYCPASSVTRAQMAVFVTRTFGLTLYGP